MLQHFPRHFSTNSALLLMSGKAASSGRPGIATKLGSIRALDREPCAGPSRLGLFGRAQRLDGLNESIVDLLYAGPKCTARVSQEVQDR